MPNGSHLRAMKVGGFGMRRQSVMLNPCLAEDSARPAFIVRRKAIQLLTLGLSRLAE